MEQQHVANISTLIHFMDGLNDPRFDMRRFVHDCDTPACALGWACSIKYLQDAGLPNVRGLDASGTIAIANMVNRVFGEVYLDLFAGSAGNGAIHSPKQWADHARRFLKSKGHDVLPLAQKQSEEFRSFMDRVLKPVPVSA